MYNHKAVHMTRSICSTRSVLLVGLVFQELILPSSNDLGESSAAGREIEEDTAKLRSLVEWLQQIRKIVGNNARVMLAQDIPRT